MNFGPYWIMSKIFHLFVFCFYLCDLIKNLDLTVYRSETIWTTWTGSKISQRKDDASRLFRPRDACLLYESMSFFMKLFTTVLKKMAPDKDTRLPYGTIFVTQNLHGCTHNTHSKQGQGETELAIICCIHCWDWALWAHHGWRLTLPKGRPEVQDRNLLITQIVYFKGRVRGLGPWPLNYTNCLF